MKRSLLVTVSIFVLVALLMSPLHAMQRGRDEENKDYPIQVKKTNVVIEKKEFFLPDFWGEIILLLNDKDQNTIRFACKNFYFWFEDKFERQNQFSGHSQWTEFQMSEKTLGIFNTLLIHHIRENVNRLECRPRNSLEQYNKNYEALEKFPGLVKRSFFKYSLQAQHLHLWKEKLAEEERDLPPKEGETSDYRVVRRQEQESKLKGVNIGLDALQKELTEKEKSLFSNNPLPLNELGLSYLRVLSKQLARPEKTSPAIEQLVPPAETSSAIKFITFDSWLKQLEKSLSVEQKECSMILSVEQKQSSMIQVFTDFEKLYDKRLPHIKADLDSSEDLTEYPIIDDYRSGRDLCLGIGKKYSDFGVLNDGTSYSDMVLNFKDATDEDLRIAQDAHAQMRKYKKASCFDQDLLDLDMPENPFKLEDTRYHDQDTNKYFNKLNL